MKFEGRRSSIKYVILSPPGAMFLLCMRACWNSCNVNGILSDYCRDKYL